MKLVGRQLRRHVKVEVEVDLVTADAKFDLIVRVILNDARLAAAHAGIGGETRQLDRTQCGSLATDSLGDAAVCHQNPAKGCRHRSPLETKKDPATFAESPPVSKDLLSTLFFTFSKCRAWDSNPSVPAYEAELSTYPPDSLTLHDDQIACQCKIRRFFRPSTGQTGQ